MNESRSFNDQSISRAIRKAISRFNNLPEEDINGRMKCVMAVAALGAIGLIGDRNMAMSNISYVEGTLSR
jgi:uncharacterized protein (UPF0147 family)